MNSTTSLQITFKIASAILVAARFVGCIVIASSAYAQSGREPDYRRIIAQQLLKDHLADSYDVKEGKVFLNYTKLGHLEISRPRWAEHNLAGWVWLVCLRSHPTSNSTVDYSVFISGTTIADARTSIVLDRCAQQTFEPYNPRPPKR